MTTLCSREYFKFKTHHSESYLMPERRRGTGVWNVKHSKGDFHGVEIQRDGRNEAEKDGYR